ncbi:MAG: hypothetical protein ACJ72W_18440 [Actinoallomurus sp.]
MCIRDLPAFRPFRQTGSGAAGATKYRWTADIKHALPASAWECLINVAYGRFGFEDRPTTANWIALASWAIAAAIVTVAVVHHRDA